ncbi:PhzF family phenazine biosynthesis protein [Arthrobacter sp. zg-ZUI100]|uniref:PhzF family phenazine biosynthesis protein n=1 Tax=Arthrobacter jiangjiafuii TaxID=2817475 RepID=UPI001AED51E2|nr:PhzF family phenazine biosynthesis protein [Arthrobacter jiangjiafuii]MBP3036113.1 PhzF family phenazine biosynthesis protein [Arthrobacter jiangjiafuii]
MKQRWFKQVDVFGNEPYLGNPLAVVLEAEGLTDAEMESFARWTNLSETTFVLPPTTDGADYRVRIFTPGGEIPFAGHPTLGTCHAWLEAGNKRRYPDVVVQECGIGLVTLHANAGIAAFAAPPLLRSGPLEDEVLDQALRALNLDRTEILASNWIDNGPGWLGLLLRNADAVLALKPDPTIMGNLRVGVIGAQPQDAETDFEVRAFVPGLGITEDPVTGSLNAGLAQWLIGASLAPERYVVTQGTAVRRSGRVRVFTRDGKIWIGGSTVTSIDGTVTL